MRFVLFAVFYLSIELSETELAVNHILMKCVRGGRVEAKSSPTITHTVFTVTGFACPQRPDPSSQIHQEANAAVCLDTPTTTRTSVDSLFETTPSTAESEPFERLQALVFQGTPDGDGNCTTPSAITQQLTRLTLPSTSHFCSISCLRLDKLQGQRLYHPVAQ